MTSFNLFIVIQKVFRIQQPTFSIVTPKSKRRKLFSYDELGTDGLDLTQPLALSVEIDVYLNDPVRTDFTSYWSRSHLNILKQVVLRIFTVQASSAPIERVFSQAGIILTSRRTRMKENLFRELVFLRVNQHLLP